MSKASTAAPDVQRTRGGKYLTFVLADEAYGVEILKVREIIGMLPITRVPRTPDHVIGVINLRGKVIPITDLRRKFGMEVQPPSERTCIIVVEARGVETGIVVDEVSEVVDIAEEAIEDAPPFGAGVDTDYILGMGKTEGSVELLLDIDRVLSQDDADAIGALTDAA